MTQMIELPLWLLLLIVLFASVTFASHFLFPSVRWFFRKRLEWAVRRLNKRLTRPIEPFKLARRYDMIQRLIYDPEVTREIVNYAREHRVPENVGFEKARAYAREIVPSFSAIIYFSVGIRLARWLVNALYNVRTGAQNDAVIQGLPKDATVVFIMNHRSNMDYVLVTYLAARASTLSYAVGEWARVWPLSRLIRSMGAYFIRRQSRGALYRRVLARYVQMAIGGGVAQGIFPEGGLSLNGRIMPLKLGLLTYVREAYEPEGRDVVFVPVAINYDRVLEDNVLIAADARGDRRFGARISVVVFFILRKLWQFLTGRYRKFGSAAVVFGEPLSLRELGSDQPVAELGAQLMRRIEAAMPILSVPLVAQVLRQAEGPIAEDELAKRVKLLLEQASGPSLSDAVRSEGNETRRALARMARQRIVTEVELGWQVAPGQEAKLAYYANSIEHYFKECRAVAE